jgi:hypothetical protein
LDLTGYEYDPIERSCEHGNEFLGSIKGGKFLDRLSDYQFPKRYSDLCSYFVRTATQIINFNLCGNDTTISDICNDKAKRIIALCTKGIRNVK